MVEISGLLVVDSIMSVEIRFRCMDPPTNLPEIGWLLWKPSSTCHRSQIGQFSNRVNLNGGWARSTGDLGQPYLKVLGL